MSKDSKTIHGIKHYQAQDGQQVLGIERVECLSCHDQTPDPDCETCAGVGYFHHEVTQAYIDTVVEQLIKSGIAPDEAEAAAISMIGG